MSNPTDRHDDTPEAGNVLRIVAGLHAGASRVLGDNEMILVGSGDDCDIVLADAGVASHHALISVVGGRNTLRALDAPVRVDSQVVHPGDPIELSAVQRIGLGGAALAFGAEQDAAWATLLPTGQAPAAARTSHQFTRRLPLIAAVAALSLVSVAIFAAVMPAQTSQVDVAGQLNAMITKHQVRDGRAHVDAGGTGVLSGTVRDAATRDSIRKELQAQGIVASLDLRTGDDIATDVREVLRTQGITAKTRFLPSGDVEVAGRFEDSDALQAAVRSRAMLAVRGVNKVRLANYAPPAEKAAKAAAAPLAHGQRTDVVNIVRGKEPHIVTLDGSRYPPGADLPDGRKLIAIGERGAWATLPDGSLEQVKIITASEIVARREAEAAARGPSQAGNPAAMQQAAIERAGSTTQASNRAVLEAAAPKAPAAPATRL